MVGLTADLDAEAEKGRDEECDNVGLGCALEHFAEVEDVLRMIDDLPRVYDSPAFEVEYERLYAILKQYYEQPHLLDPHLDRLLGRCLLLVKDKDAPLAMKHAVFSYMYQIIRVRGYKVVIRHLPHEVSDLLAVLSQLEAQDPADKETWRSRFVLLLWLSIVVMIPFHMSRLDGFTPSETDDGSTKKLTVMERIFNICKTYALSKDSCAEACAFLASKFLVRSDVKDVYMGAFFEWVMSLQCGEGAGAGAGAGAAYGALACVAAVLKHGKRSDLLPHAPRLLRWLAAHARRHGRAMLVRKYSVKIAQRIGLTFLRPRVAAWRYTRGARSLAASLGAPAPAPPGAPAPAGDSSDATDAPADDDEQDIPQEVEEVVELLLAALRDEDTVVRWGGAKGAGRLCARLPPAAAAEVAACVLALAAPACHGACMALAELARRGLLSPPQLAEAVDVICAALRRDEARAGGGAGCGGGAGGGRAARDAACHCAWAVARAYPAPALAPHAARLACALAAAACFDREINCRRAASAAFQENVGRHGMFPRGIDVLTAADFHAVGPRAHAYLVVAPQVAQYEEYTQPLLDHLLELKVPHWDGAIRELAAQAVNRIAPLLPQYVARAALPALLARAGAEGGAGELAARHGAVLAVGEAVLALSQTSLSTAADGSESGGISLVEPAVLARALALAGGLRARGLLRGLGGELLRRAACACVAALSRAGLRAPAPVVDEWLTLIEECLAHEADAVRKAAAEALPAVVEQHLSRDVTGPRDASARHGDVALRDKRAALVRRYCAQLADTGANGLHLRMGFATAIGALPAFMVGEHAALVTRALCECARVTDGTRTWAEARRDALLALAAVPRGLGVRDTEPSARPYVDDIRDALLRGLREYTTDVRGDIGAWVREAAMAGLVALIQQCAAEAPELNAEGGAGAGALRAACAALAQQAVEKIDRTRAIAGRLFVRLVHNDPPIPEIPELEALRQIFPREEVGGEEGAVLWLFPGHTMPRFVRLLRYPPYRRALLAGLCVSAGELTESLVKHTTSALFSWLRSLHERELGLLRAVCADIVAVFAEHLHDKRVAGPMLNFLDRLLSSGALSPVLEDPDSTFAADVLRLVQLELKGGKSIYKLLDSINVLCQLIQVGGPVARRSLSQLCVCLCHRDRYVRRCAAARLYEALALYGGDSPVPASELDQVMSVLADTDWEQDVEALRPVRNSLCDRMGIKRPVPKQPPAAAGAVPDTAEGLPASLGTLPATTEGHPDTTVAP